MPTPLLFKKRPVVIEAMQITDPAARTAVADWITSHGGYVDVPLDGDILTVVTLEGPMVARDHWWIIRGIQGEFYPCEPVIFAATYEPAPDGEERS